MKFISILFLFVVLWTVYPQNSNASDARYIQEIKEHVWHPCMRQAIRNEGMDDKNVDNETLQTLIDVSAPGTTQNMIDNILPFVRGKDTETRKTFYVAFRAACIGGLK